MFSVLRKPKHYGRKSEGGQKIPSPKTPSFFARPSEILAKFLPAARWWRATKNRQSGFPENEF